VSRYDTLAAQVLRLVRAERASAAETPAADPTRLLPVARLALARRRGQVAFQRVAKGTLALAAAAGLVLALGPWLRSPPRRAVTSSLVRHPFSVVKADGASASVVPSLDPGVTLQAPPTAPVELASADGTVVTLEARGQLALLEQSATRRFSLRRGAVRAHVAHLPAGERFIIATDDAEVEVHGTMFRVSLADADPTCEDGRRTRVAVTEGIVSVRAGGRETLVAAGDTWPACARTDAPRAPAAVAEVATPPAAPAIAVAVSEKTSPHRRMRALPAVTVPVPPALSPQPSPGLAAANDVFAAAVRAKRAHRPAEALRLFARLIELAPDGPLAEGAAAQQMKLLATSDPTAARRAAADYLARYPDGFARDDARRLAGSGP